MSDHNPNTLFKPSSPLISHYSLKSLVSSQFRPKILIKQHSLPDKSRDTSNQSSSSLHDDSNSQPAIKNFSFVSLGNPYLPNGQPQSSVNSLNQENTPDCFQQNRSRELSFNELASQFPNFDKEKTVNTQRLNYISSFQQQIINALGDSASRDSDIGKTEGSLQSASFLNHHFYQNFPFQNERKHSDCSNKQIKMETPGFQEVRGMVSVGSKIIDLNQESEKDGPSLGTDLNKKEDLIDIQTPKARKEAQEQNEIPLKNYQFGLNSQVKLEESKMTGLSPSMREMHKLKYKIQTARHKSICTTELTKSNQRIQQELKALNKFFQRASWRTQSNLDYVFDRRSRKRIFLTPDVRQENDSKSSGGIYRNRIKKDQQTSSLSKNSQNNLTQFTAFPQYGAAPVQEITISNPQNPQYFQIQQAKCKDRQFLELKQVDSEKYQSRSSKTPIFIREIEDTNNVFGNQQFYNERTKSFFVTQSDRLDESQNMEILSEEAKIAEFGDRGSSLNKPLSNSANRVSLVDARDGNLPSSMNQDLSYNLISPTSMIAHSNNGSNDCHQFSQPSLGHQIENQQKQFLQTRSFKILGLKLNGSFKQAPTQIADRRKELSIEINHDSQITDRCLKIQLSSLDQQRQKAQTILGTSEQKLQKKTDLISPQNMLEYQINFDFKKIAHPQNQTDNMSDHIYMQKKYYWSRRQLLDSHRGNTKTQISKSPTQKSRHHISIVKVDRGVKSIRRLPKRLLKDQKSSLKSSFEKEASRSQSGQSGISSGHIKALTQGIDQNQYQSKHSGEYYKLKMGSDSGVVQRNKTEAILNRNFPNVLDVQVNNQPISLKDHILETKDEKYFWMEHHELSQSSKQCSQQLSMEKYCKRVGVVEKDEEEKESISKYSELKMEIGSPSMNQRHRDFAYIKEKTQKMPIRKRNPKSKIFKSYADDGISEKKPYDLSRQMSAQKEGDSVFQKFTQFIKSESINLGSEMTSSLKSRGKRQINAFERILQSQFPSMRPSQYKQVTLEMFFQICKIKCLMQEDYQEFPEEQKINFKFKKSGFKRLLIFDLDETLIHVKREEEDEGYQEDDPVDQNFEPDEFILVEDPKTGESFETGFSVRPYARQCLEFVNQYFEVAIFTAGHEWFAEKIIDFLDPTQTLIQHRFYRQHACTLGDEVDFPFFVKDLSIFQGDVQLEDILIVDNNIYSFAFNLPNGIPILSFMGDKKDCELLKVMQYLNSIRLERDMVSYNNSQFKLQQIFDSNMEEFIGHYNIEDWSEAMEDIDFDDDGITSHSLSKFKRKSFEDDQICSIVPSETNSIYLINDQVRGQIDPTESSDLDKKLRLVTHMTHKPFKLCHISQTNNQQDQFKGDNQELFLKDESCNEQNGIEQQWMQMLMIDDHKVVEPVNSQRIMNQPRKISDEESKINEMYLNEIDENYHYSGSNSSIDSSSLLKQPPQIDKQDFTISPVNRTSSNMQDRQEGKQMESGSSGGTGSIDIGTRQINTHQQLRVGSSQGLRMQGEYGGRRIIDQKYLISNNNAVDQQTPKPTTQQLQEQHVTRGKDPYDISSRSQQLFSFKCDRNQIQQFLFQKQKTNDQNELDPKCYLELNKTGTFLLNPELQIQKEMQSEELKQTEVHQILQTKNTYQESFLQIPFEDDTSPCFGKSKLSSPSSNSNVSMVSKQSRNKPLDQGEIKPLLTPQKSQTQLMITRDSAQTRQINTSNKQVRIHSLFKANMNMSNGKKQFSVNSNNSSLMIRQPNWRIRRNVIQQRQKSLNSNNRNSSSNVILARIERDLDQLGKEIQKSWNSGALQQGILRSNPEMKDHFIIDSNKSLQRCSNQKVQKQRTFLNPITSQYVPEQDRYISCESQYQENTSQISCNYGHEESSQVSKQVTQAYHPSHALNLTPERFESSQQIQPVSDQKSYLNIQEIHTSNFKYQNQKTKNTLQHMKDIFRELDLKTKQSSQTKEPRLQSKTEQRVSESKLQQFNNCGPTKGREIINQRIPVKSQLIGSIKQGLRKLDQLNQKPRNDLK